MEWSNSLILFDGVCDKTKELQTLYGSMSNNVKWIISSSSRYMFVRLTNSLTIDISTGFSAKILYGNEILNQDLVKRGKSVTVLSVSKGRNSRDPLNFEFYCIFMRQFQKISQFDRPWGYRVGNPRCPFPLGWEI